MSKYIELAIVTEQGHTNSCWVPSCASLLMTTKPANPETDSLTVVVAGYKDKASKLASKTVSENTGVTIDLTTLTNWPALKTEILNFLVTDSTSPLVGGVLTDL